MRSGYPGKWCISSWIKIKIH